MIDYFFPEEEQRFFTDREHVLALLAHSYDLLTQGIRKHLALSGLRRVGKTVVMKEFLRRSLLDKDDRIAVVYMDLTRLSRTPETFTVQYLGYLLYWLANDGSARLENCMNQTTQLTMVGRMGYSELTDSFSHFYQELQKAKPDQHFLLEMAFNAPEVYARASGQKVMILIDEFPEILALDNFYQVGDVLALFRSVLQAQSRVGYVVAGSMIGLMERIFLQAESPLFVHFQMESIGHFGKDDCAALARKRLAIISEKVPADVLAMIYRVTGGHPFYIYATCTRIIESVVLLQKKLTPETVQEAFTLETLGSTGRIYNLCRYVLEQSLQNVRGETMPQAILQVLAQEPGGMSLTEISGRLKRPSGAMRKVLNWLIDADLIEQRDDKTYVYRDAVLQIWVAYYYSGLQLTGLPSQQVLSSLVKELMERYQRVSNELGQAKESQVRELLQRFRGQEIDGELLGLSGTITLPVLNRVAPFISPDGQVEIDALAEGSERWAVEIKWRGRLSGRKELGKLSSSADWLAEHHLPARAWFISKSGFTTDAIEYARQVGMMVTDGRGIEEMIKELGKKSDLG
ncbi:MAG: restriction endonuclease [Anaerolineales bacterium]|nr:restriction endonuclease [Anaerolineales bacterium]